MSESSINARYEACIKELSIVAQVLEAIDAWRILAEDRNILKYWHLKEIAKLELRYQRLTNLKRKLEKQRRGFWSLRKDDKYLIKYTKVKAAYLDLYRKYVALEANYKVLRDESRAIEARCKNKPRHLLDFIFRG